MAKKVKEKAPVPAPEPKPKPKESLREVLVAALKQFHYPIRTHEAFDADGKKKDVQDFTIYNPKEAVVWVDAPYNNAKLFGVIENGELAKDGLLQVLRHKLGDQANFSFTRHIESVKHNDKTEEREYGKIQLWGLAPS